MEKKKKEVPREKTLYEWAKSAFFDDEALPFLRYCEDYFYDPGDRITYEEFQKLKKGFEY